MPTTESNIKKNLERTRMILGLMLEKEKISQAEYEEAMAETEHMQFNYNPEAGKVMETSNQSYFVDEVIKAVKNELMKKYNYNEQAPWISYTTAASTSIPPCSPRFRPRWTRFSPIPSISAPKTRGLKRLPGIHGGRGACYRLCARPLRGRGEKEGSVFNRATQALRSPGSSIKPILVYARHRNPQHYCRNGC